MSDPELCMNFLAGRQTSKAGSQLLAALGLPTNAVQGLAEWGTEMVCAHQHLDFHQSRFENGF